MRRGVIVVCLVVAAAVPGTLAVSDDGRPRADAGLDRTVRINETVYLDGGGSLDPDGRIVSYDWRIRTPTGAVRRKSGVRARFTPTTPGRYVVRLRVTDAEGYSRTDTLYVDARAGTPTGSPTDTPTSTDTPASTDSPPPTAATPTSTDTPASTDSPPPTAATPPTTEDPTRTDPTDGTRTTSPRTTPPPDGSPPPKPPTASPTQPSQPPVETPTPSNAPPQGELTGPTTVSRGDQATFQAQVYDPDGEITNYDWTVSGTGVHVTYTPTEPAGTTVTIAVVVTDNDGASRRFEHTFTVTADGDNTPPDAHINGPATLTVGERATYTIAATDPDGAVTGYAWQSPTDTTGQRLRWAFQTPGNHTLRAVVTDDDGATTTVSRTVRVASPDGTPIASLSGPATAPNGSRAVYELSASDPDGGPLTVIWYPPTTDGRFSPTTHRDTGTGPFHYRATLTGAAGDVRTIRAQVIDDEGNSRTVTTDTRLTTTERDTVGGSSAPTVSDVSVTFDPDDPTKRSDSDVVRNQYTLSVAVSHPDGEDLTIEWHLGDGTRKLQQLSDVSGSRTATIEHTFLSDTGRRVWRSITVVVRDESGDHAVQQTTRRVYTYKRGSDLRLVARANGQSVGGGGRLTVPAGTRVTFEVWSAQSFELEVGDGVSRAMPANRHGQTLTHRYDSPGTRVAVVTSIEGVTGISTAQVTIEVTPVRYTEYRYRRLVEHTEKTTATDRPPGSGWTRAGVAERRWRNTGETRRTRVGTSPTLPGVTNPSVRWRQTGTELETTRWVQTRIAATRPGDGWSLADRRVDSHTRTETRTKRVWREQRYSFGVWTLVGTRTTRRPVYRTGVTAPPGWTPVIDTGRDVRTGVRIEWRPTPGVRYTGRRTCVRRMPTLIGGSRCLAYRYQHRVPVYDDVYLWRGWRVDTDYQYERTVHERVTVWEHEWRRTTYRTIRYAVYERERLVVEYRWTRTTTTVGDVVWSLEKPPVEAYVNGTLTAVHRRCDTDKGHFDTRACE